MAGQRNVRPLLLFSFISVSCPFQSYSALLPTNGSFSVAIYPDAPAYDDGVSIGSQPHLENKLIND